MNSIQNYCSLADIKETVYENGSLSFIANLFLSGTVGGSLGSSDFRSPNR